MSKAVSVTINTANLISASIDPLPMGPGNNQQIQWDIPNSQTGGWTFTSDGITLASNNGQFSNPTIAEHGKRFIWHDANTVGGQYKYTIKVTNGTTVLEWDPTIINQSSLT